MQAWRFQVLAHIHSSHFYLFSVYFSVFPDCIIVFIPCMEIPFILCLCCYLLCRRGNNHFDVHFRRNGPYSFLSKDGKDAVREGGNGWKGVYFPPESATFPLMNNIFKVLFPICTLSWRVNNCFPPRKGINRRNESTIIIIKIVALRNCNFMTIATVWYYSLEIKTDFCTIETWNLKLRKLNN